MDPELKPAGLHPLRTPLSFFSTMALRAEKLRVSVQVRQAHLVRNGTPDIETEKLHELLTPVEDFIDGHLRTCLDEHPTRHWWSRISGMVSKKTGLPLEPLGKLIGEIERFGRWYQPDDPMVPIETPMHLLTKELKDSIASPGGRRIVYTDEVGHPWVWVSAIERLTTTSKLWRYAGLVPGQKRVKGEKLDFNGTVKTMAFRVAQFGCILPGNPYKALFDRYKERKALDLAEAGVSIKATPKARWCEKCQKPAGSATTKFCGDCGSKLTTHEEPEGEMYKGHLNNMAVRYMSKMFLSHLHTVWREALGLSVRPPYPVEHRGHQTIITPWDMCDLP